MLSDVGVTPLEVTQNPVSLIKSQGLLPLDDKPALLIQTSSKKRTSHSQSSVKGSGLLGPPPADLQPTQKMQDESKSGDRNEEELLLDLLPEQIEIPVKTQTVKEFTILSTTNGKVKTELTIKLILGSPRPIPRKAAKLDLTDKRVPKYVPPPQGTGQLLPDPLDQNTALGHVGGRVSPGLLSDPGDDLLMMKSRTSEDHSHEEHRKYSRETMFAIKELKRSSQLPSGLPNIPELLPTSKQVVIVQTNSNAGPHKANHHNQNHTNNYNNYNNHNSNHAHGHNHNHHNAHHQGHGYHQGRRDSNAGHQGGYKNKGHGHFNSGHQSGYRYNANNANND